MALWYTMVFTFFVMRLHSYVRENVRNCTRQTQPYNFSAAFTVCLCLLFLPTLHISPFISVCVRQSEMDSPLPIPHLLICWHESLSASFSRSRSAPCTTCCLSLPLVLAVSLGFHLKVPLPSTDSRHTCIHTNTDTFSKCQHICPRRQELYFLSDFYLNWRLNTKIVCATKYTVLMDNSLLFC